MKIVVTAGPTREYLDPVRFLSNPSTGKMGFAVAAEAARRGHDVTLVAGPVALKTPNGVRRADVVSARETLRTREPRRTGFDFHTSTPCRYATRQLSRIRYDASSENDAIGKSIA